MQDLQYYLTAVNVKITDYGQHTFRCDNKRVHTGPQIADIYTGS